MGPSKPPRMSEMLGSETNPASLAPVGVWRDSQPVVSQGSPMWPLAVPWAVLPTAAGAGSSAKGSSASSPEPWETRHLESPPLGSSPGELTWARPPAYPASPDQASPGHSVLTGVPTASLCRVLPDTCTPERSRRGPALRKLPVVGTSAPHGESPARRCAQCPQNSEPRVWRRAPQVCRGGSETGLSWASRHEQNLAVPGRASWLREPQQPESADRGRQEKCGQVGTEVEGSRGQAVGGAAPSATCDLGRCLDGRWRRAGDEAERPLVMPGRDLRELVSPG